MEGRTFAKKVALQNSLQLENLPDSLRLASKGVCSYKPSAAV